MRELLDDSLASDGDDDNTLSPKSETGALAGPDDDSNCEVASGSGVEAAVAVAGEETLWQDTFLDADSCSDTTPDSASAQTAVLTPSDGGCDGADDD
eukprot:1965775-Alexandrium_andersonii.AAC.1